MSELGFSSSSLYYIYQSFGIEQGGGYHKSRYIGSTVRPVYGPRKTSKPSASTNNITQVSDTSICIEGTITDEGGSNIIEHGVVYGTNSSLTLETGIKCVCIGLPKFTCTITGLQAGTTYYVPAYATNAVGTSYGGVKTVKVLGSTLSEPTGTDNGHAYMDLGLSVNWATCNVGASSAEQSGGYDAWGETTSKDSYNWASYRWCNAADTMLTKYCVSSEYGYIDYLTTL